MLRNNQLLDHQSTNFYLQTLYKLLRYNLIQFFALKIYLETFNDQSKACSENCCGAAWNKFKIKTKYSHLLTFFNASKSLHIQTKHSMFHLFEDLESTSFHTICQPILLSREYQSKQRVSSCSLTHCIHDKRRQKNAKKVFKHTPLHFVTPLSLKTLEWMKRNNKVNWTKHYCGGKKDQWGIFLQMIPWVDISWLKYLLSRNIYLSAFSSSLPFLFDKSLCSFLTLVGVHLPRPLSKNLSDIYNKGISLKESQGLEINSYLQWFW